MTTETTPRGTPRTPARTTARTTARATPVGPAAGPPRGVGLIEQLRGLGRERPSIDPDLAARLRARLEEAARPAVGLPLGITVSVTKRHLQRVLACERHLVATLGEARHVTIDMIGGQLLDYLFAQVATGEPLGSDPVGDALEAAGVSGDEQLVEEFRSLSEDDRAELRYSVAALAGQLAERWPPLPRNALPRLQEPLRIPLAGGRVVLSGRVDLALGHPGVERAGSTLVDIKSGARRHEDMADAAWYGLLETLRSRAAPFQTGNYYLRDGGLVLDVVTTETLTRQADRVAEGVRRMVALAGGAEPGTRPSDLCPWCPALRSCPTGRRHVSVQGLETPWGEPGDIDADTGEPDDEESEAHGGGDDLDG